MRRLCRPVTGCGMRVENQGPPMRFLEPVDGGGLAEAIDPGHYRPLVLTAARVGRLLAEVEWARVPNGAGETLWCRRGDLNPHALSGTSPSS